MMTRALFFDIDGTLVSFQTHRIPESTVEGLRKARENGYMIFIATGRPFVIMNNIPEIQGKGLIDGYITMNGAYCFKGDPVFGNGRSLLDQSIKVLHKKAIRTSDVMAAAMFCKGKNLPCIFVEESRMSVCNQDEMVRKIFYEHLNVTSLPEADFNTFDRLEIFQISPFIDKTLETELMAGLKECEPGRWHPSFMDITAYGNTKSAGLDIIAREFSLDMKEIMAFGDGGNDISMLMQAGTGVAMGNASENVRKAADYITNDVDEDGIYNALKKFNII